MGYTLSGTTFKGVSFKGQKTIGSYVPDLWLDYRRNTIIEDADRVASIIDGGINGFFFPHNGGDNGRPFLTSDGIRPNHANAAGGLLRPASANMKFLHDSSEYILIFVGSLAGSESTNARPLVTSSGSAVPGFALNFQPANRTYQLVAGRSGGNYYSILSSTNLIPASGTFFFAVKFYGGTTGDNLKVYVNGTEYLHQVTSGSFSTADPTAFTAMKQGANTTNPLYSTKLVIAKNCAGLSDPQIDALLSEIIATIKLDPEYFSLITP